jgi:hypothetical protein
MPKYPSKAMLYDWMINGEVTVEIAATDENCKACPSNN